MGDQILVDFCSPTLAGLKTGNLFTVEYDEKKEFIKEIREFNERLKNKGIRIIPVRYLSNKAVVYLYRPEMLKKDFTDREVCKILKEKGYSYSNTDLCVAELARHLAEDASFPHEIGLFLGYPVEDVQGFMRSPKEGVKYTGFWKVYGDIDSALKTFERYKKCTEIYSTAHERGASLEQLTVRVS